MSDAPIWKRKGFKTQWAYRNAQAQAKGFKNASQQSKAKGNRKPRDYKAERERRNRLAESRGYKSASNERTVKESLKKFGIDFTTFNDMRRANAKHWNEVRDLGKMKSGAKFPVAIHEYHEPTNMSPGKMTHYVVSYYHAMVDPEHNWESKLNDDGVWEVSEHETANGPAMTPDSDDWWYEWLVEASEIYDEETYDERYTNDHGGK